MATQIAANLSSNFDFLKLPLELRNHIYSLHLSNEGEVGYKAEDQLLQEITHDEPAIKPLLGVNFLRVCKQVYDEAVLYAYRNRKWAMGYAPITPDRLTVNCAQRIACIPPDTAENI
ncbi:hypothetical protein KCU65_g2880, partial [Aureobasidium melanogenum]